MPTNLPADDLREAELAIHNAREVRTYHRKRTERLNAQRQQDIEMALQRLKAAMLPLRSEIGKFQYGPQTEAAEKNRAKIRAVSADIQAERRKLWKMLNGHKPKRKKK